MLRKYGLENPNTGLVHKVKGIYFGDMMEIRDPLTKQKVKKHMKPFMVNLAARRLEDGQIILPESEDIKNGLVGQIRDYTVIRTTALGQPIYSDDNDHTIVAWMLSILAATIEFSDINKQNRAINIGITGRFGQKYGDELKKNAIITEEEKRQNHAIIPRWHKQSLFKETTLRNALTYIKRRNSFFKKANSRGDFDRKRVNNPNKSRAVF